MAEGKGNTLNGVVISMVEDEGSILKTEEPGGGRGTSASKNGVSKPLQCLETAFSRILVLLVGLTLPIANIKSAENV